MTHDPRLDRPVSEYGPVHCGDLDLHRGAAMDRNAEILHRSSEPQVASHSKMKFSAGPVSGFTYNLETVVQKPVPLWRPAVSPPNLGGARLKLNSKHLPEPVKNNLAEQPVGVGIDVFWEQHVKNSSNCLGCARGGQGV